MCSSIYAPSCDNALHTTGYLVNECNTPCYVICTIYKSRFITLHAKLSGAVFSNWSCLFVFVGLLPR